MSGRRLRPASPIRLPDKDAETVNRDHRERIDELQSLPFAGARIFNGIALPTGVEVTVRHGLGRAPLWVGISVPRIPVTAVVTDIMVLEWRDKYFTTGAPIDRTQFIVLAAYNTTTTITVDVVVL